MMGRDVVSTFWCVMVVAVVCYCTGVACLPGAPQLQIQKRQSYSYVPPDRTFRLGAVNVAPQNEFPQPPHNLFPPPPTREQNDRFPHGEYFIMAPAVPAPPSSDYQLLPMLMQRRFRVQPIDPNTLHERARGSICGLLNSPTIKASVYTPSSSLLYISNIKVHPKVGESDVYIYVGPSETPEKMLSVYANLKCFKQKNCKPPQGAFLIDSNDEFGKKDKLIIVDMRGKELASMPLYNCYPPEDINLGPLQNVNHGVSSGDVVLRTSRTVTIKNFVHPGETAAVNFVVGIGTGERSKRILPDEKHSKKPIRKYEGEDVTLTLDGPLTFNEVDYISVYCWSYKLSFGEVRISEEIKKMDMVPEWTRYTDNHLHELHRLVRDYDDGVEDM